MTKSSFQRLPNSLNNLNVKKKTMSLIIFFLGHEKFININCAIYGILIVLYL